MSKPAWTPGPWVFGSDAQRLAIRATAEAYEIATVHRWVPPFDDSYEANARLIAEAPAMAEALADLVEVVDYIERTYGSRINPPTLDNARAILARINGETGR